MITEKFKNLFDFAPKSGIKAGDGLDEGNFPFFTSSSILSKRIDKALYNDEALIFGTGGSASIHFAGEPFSTSTDCIVAITKSEELNAKFVYYYLFGNIHFLERGFKGAGLKHISKKYIENLDIPVLPFETQNKIVAVLDKAFSLEKKRKKVFELFETFKWSVFYNFFSDGKQFEVKTIEKIASKEKYSLSSGPFGSNLTSKDYVEKGVIILRGTNITSGRLDLSDIKYVSEEKALELRRSEIKPDDVVIVAVGSSGKALKVPSELKRAIISQNFNKVTCDDEIVNPLFFEFCFNSEIVQWQLRSIMTNAGRTFLSLTNIKQIKIPVPPIDIQKKFENIIISVEKNFSTLTGSNYLLNELTKSLIQKVFNGELNFNIDIELDALIQEIDLQKKENDLSKIITDFAYLQRLIDRLNSQEFKERDLYDKAKHAVFQILKEDNKLVQEYDENSKSLKLAMK